MIVGLLGGAGFIGTWLEQELRGRGHTVWSAGRRQRSFRANYLRLDATTQWRPPWGIGKVLWEPSVLVNLVRPDDVRAAFLSSICIRHWGLPVIQVSSTAVYGLGRVDDRRVAFPRSRYGWAKLVQDIILNECVVRLPYIWGKEMEPCVVLDKWLIQARQGKSLMVYDGFKRLDFVHVQDVAKVLADLVEAEVRPGRLLVGTGSDWRCLVHLAVRIGAVHNVPVVFVNRVGWRLGADQQIRPSKWLYLRGLPRCVEEVLPWSPMAKCNG